MSDAPRTEPVRRSHRVEALCREFEQALQAAGRGEGPPPSIEAFLAGCAPDDRAGSLAALLLLEWARRDADGQPPALADSLARFPDSPAVVAAAWRRRQEPTEPAGDAWLQTATPAQTRPEFSEPPPSRLPPQEQPTDDLPPGEALPGGYRDLVQIGKGGMGVVYRAVDPRLRRPVALKMLTDASPSRLVRFRIEAEALARLQHPHIVTIHGFEVYEGDPCLVMEFVAGGTLEQRLRRSPMPAAEAARLVAILARAVQAAHGVDVVHRDLKPVNILMAAPYPGASDTGLALGAIPKVSDFGIARLVQADQRPTLEGGCIGTPHYMAPEQAAGSLDVGPPADVWALGIIFYELLTGLKPFVGETMLATLAKVCTGTPRPPRDLDAHVSDELEALCLACLAKDPAARPTSEVLAARLEQLVAEGRAAAAHAGKPRPGPRSRTPLYVALAGTAALLLAAGTFPLWKPAPPDEAQPGPPEQIGTTPAGPNPGAPKPPPVVTNPPRKLRPFVTRADVFRTIRDHLREAPADKQQSLRYLTLANLHDDPRVSDDDLRRARTAVARTLNALSWQKQPVAPRAIGPGDVVLAFDLEELGWDDRTHWLPLLRADPYGQRHDDHPDRELRDLEKEIRGLAGPDAPYLRADWFVTAATQPPLYHTLLELPDDLGALLTRLGVSPLEGFEKGSLLRGGVGQRGQAHRNRLMERHATRDGYCWVGYSFTPANGRSDLLRFPLGPLSLYPPGKHPFADQAFTHDGTEALFSLPNGLEAYFVADPAGKRLDRLPVPLAGDPRQADGPPEVQPARSCLACHERGPVDFEDGVREGARVAGEARARVRVLYPEPRALAGALEADRKRYRAALDRATGPLLGPADGSEAITSTARAYSTRPLDLTTVGAEFEMQPPRDVLEKHRARLTESKLEALLEEGGTVSRERWVTPREGSSPRQDVARILGATPLLR